MKIRSPALGSIIYEPQWNSFQKVIDRHRYREEDWFEVVDSDGNYGSVELQTIRKNYILPGEEGYPSEVPKFTNFRDYEDGL